MIIMMQIPPSSYEEIKKLIDEGKYPSIESFAEIALLNQLTLEHNHSNDRRTRTGINQVFDFLRNIPRGDGFCVPSAPSSSDQKIVPLSGLINRYFPIKVVLRLLYNFTTENNSSWVHFSEFATTLVNVCYELKAQIEKFEGKTMVVRGESNKVGFPQAGAKSQQRFVDTYVGRLRADGRIEGVIGDLEFGVINRERDDRLSIGITRKGAEFAWLKSPILDDLINGAENIKSPFFPEEICFLLNHLKLVKPGEYDLLNYLYQCIANGADTPQKLYPLARSFFENQDRSLFKGTLINISQGVARLIEMRLVRIEKSHGVYTRYKIQSAFPKGE